MARRRKLDQLPTATRRELLEEIAKGTTYREITERYGLAKSTVSKYVREVAAEFVAAARKEYDIIEGTYVLETAGLAAQSLRRLLEACNRYLADPDNPDDFNVGPRATEVDVIFDVINDQGDIVRTEKLVLQDALDKVDGLHGNDLSGVRYRHSDPRDLVVKTANAINRQLAVLTNIQEKALGIAADKDARREIVESQVWQEVSEALTDALSDCPKARNKVAGALRRIRTSASRR